MKNPDNHNSVFICHTVNHLLRTCIFISKYYYQRNETKPTVIVPKSAGLSPELLLRFKCNFDWIDFVSINDLAIYKYRKLIRIFCWLGFATPFVKLIKCLNPNSNDLWAQLISFNTQIYIFNDSQLLSEIIMHKNKNVILIEEGLANYLNVRNIYSRKEQIIVRLLGSHFRLGRSKNIKHVFLCMNHQFTGELAKKIRMIDLKLASLPDSHKNSILKVFLDNHIESTIMNATGQIFFVVMQRLTLIGFSDSECKNFYRDVAKYYTAPNRTIYFKKHPSDSIDYSEVKGGDFIGGSIPLEVLIELMGANNRLDFAGFSLVSSSVANVGRAVEWGIAFPDIKVLEQLSGDTLRDYWVGINSKS